MIRHLHCHILSLLFLTVATSVGTAAAQTGFDIYRFPKGGERGSQPYSSLTPDAAGNLYGTTEFGGNGPCVDYAKGCGTIFRLTPPTTDGGAWTEAVLYNFQDRSDGRSPFGGVIFDRAGNLYGTTQYGGALGAGTVFELQAPAKASTWTMNILFSFSGSNGLDSVPSGNLLLDASGNIYGSAGMDQVGVNCGYICGAAFQLSPPSVQGGKWKYKNIHGFGSGYDGQGPTGGLIFGKAGALYGTTIAGGRGTGFFCWGNVSPDGCGSVFRITPPANSGTTWTEDAIYSLNGSPDGMSPSAGIVGDSVGNLYGVTEAGGVGSCPLGCGTVFQLIPPAGSGEIWTENLLYQFQGGGDGEYPFGVLVLDGAGNVYGTTIGGGNVCTLTSMGCGTVFRLSPPTVSGAPWTKTSVHVFTGGDGESPSAGLLFSNGVLYGTTAYGGYKCPTRSAPQTCGTVFKILP